MTKNKWGTKQSGMTYKKKKTAAAYNFTLQTDYHNSLCMHTKFSKTFPAEG